GLLVERGLQLAEHRGGRGGDQLEVLVQTVLRDHAVLHHAGQTGPGLDADDAGAETFRIGRQLLDGGDVRVLRDGQHVGGAVVVRDDVLEVVAVLIHVGRVGDVRPGRGVEIDIAFGQRGVGDGGVRELLELDRV